MDWFTSDTHFNHANIVVYCSRPFKDVNEMNRVLIERWNARVKPEDTVYHLGDFALCSKARIAEFRKALNGRIVLIRGNHDRSPKAMLECGFEEVREELVYDFGRYKPALLRHHPEYGFSTATYGLHLSGHVHEKWASRKTEAGGLIVNVGVDQNDFQPITIEEALVRPQRPSVTVGPLLKCRICPRTIAKPEFFADGCPKCGARETIPFEYE